MTYHIFSSEKTSTTAGTDKEFLYKYVTETLELFNGVMAVTECEITESPFASSYVNNEGRWGRKYSNFFSKIDQLDKIKKRHTAGNEYPFHDRIDGTYDISTKKTADGPLSAYLALYECNKNLVEALRTDPSLRNHIYYPSDMKIEIGRIHHMHSGGLYFGGKNLLINEAGIYEQIECHISVFHPEIRIVEHHYGISQSHLRGVLRAKDKEAFKSLLTDNDNAGRHRFMNRMRIRPQIMSFGDFGFGGPFRYGDSLRDEMWEEEFYFKETMEPISLSFVLTHDMIAELASKAKDNHIKISLEDYVREHKIFGDLVV